MARSPAPAGYSGTPLPRKLGIKPGSVTALIGAPEGFESILGPLPEGARLRRGARGRFDLALWFPKSRKDLDARVEPIVRHPWTAGLWILWPKKASGVKSDLDGNVVRAAGLGAGLVDYKVAAVDATWSGLKFARRKGDD